MHPHPVHGSAARWLGLLLGAVFLAQVGFGLAVHSGTCDELGAHLPAGILAWKSGHPGSGFANPPLGQLLVAAGPVLIGTADRPLSDSPRDLWPARVPVVLLGVALVLWIGRLGAQAAGWAAGVAAAAAAALSPDLVAHAGLATLDLPVTAFTAFAAGLAWRWTRSGDRTSLLGWAVAIAAAVLVKSTALFFLAAVPLGAALLPGSPARRLSRLTALGLAGAAASVGGAWAIYGAGPARFGVPAMWVDSVLSKAGQAGHGHFSYLAGRRSAGGFPEYFALALALKTPLAVQITAWIGAWSLARRRHAGDPAGFVALVLGPALAFVAWMSLGQHVHVGVRHVLPAVPALLILAGTGAAWLIARGLAGRVAAALLATWLGIVGLRATPDQLAYFHEAAGGPDRGDRWLIDSNLDWGQDEGRFRAWAEGHDVTFNPDRPTSGTVAAGINALHGILSRDDLRLRWLGRCPVVRTFGHSIRVYEVTEAPLRDAAAEDAVAAVDYAWWLVGAGRARDATDVLRRPDVAALARDPVHGREWWRVLGEAQLLDGDLESARQSAERAQDDDLAAEASYRRIVRDGARPGVADAARAVRALARRGHADEAAALGRELFGRDPLEVPPDDADVTASEASRLRSLGRERDALLVAGRVLARHPGNDDALWLYGELVVRRKLGLAEYPWPPLDWSRAGRSGAGG